MENVLTELNQAVLDKFDSVDYKLKPFKNDPQNVGGGVAVVQLTDAHLNELIDVPGNRYDFEVASMRMQKYAHEVKESLQCQNVDKVVIAMTGDMLNSNRRVSELLAQATNRISAALLATQLVQMFITDLASTFEYVEVAYVSGNESRVEKDFTHLDVELTNNFDSMIFKTLKMLFKNETSRVKFIDGGNVAEFILEINGKNLLLTHGTFLGNNAAGVTKMYAKWAAKGIIVHYSIFGHFHSAFITDTFARSGALCGANDYSEGLNYSSRASQNIHLFKENGTIRTYRIDVQDAEDEGWKGYPIQKEMAEYNAKSATKLYKETAHTIVKIVS